MLIPGKSHSRVESRNFRVSIETLDFARVRTFYQRDRCGMASGGARGGNYRLVPDSVPGRCGDPIDWSDRHSKRWCTRNVAKRPAGGVWLGKCSGRSASGQWAGESPPAPVGCRWTVGRRRGQIGAQNGGQWPCLRRHGARVETQAGNAVGGDAIADWPPDAGYGKSTGPPSDVAGRSFPIEADWSGHICTAGPMQWHK